MMVWTGMKNPAQLAMRASLECLAIALYESHVRAQFALNPESGPFPSWESLDAITRGAWRSRCGRMMDE